MGAVAMLRRGELRRGWRGVLALAVLVGVIGAVVLAGAAGARRSSTALARFAETSRMSDVEITAGEATPAQLDAFRRTKGVAAVAELRQLAMFPKGVENIPLAGALDTQFGTVVDRPRVVQGRRANPDAPLELEVGERLAENLGLHVGDRLAFESISPAGVARAFHANEFPAADGPRVRLRVVGIVRRPLDLGLRGAVGGVVVPTPAFVAAYRDRIGTFAGTILRVRTEHGASDVPRVVAAARRIFGASDFFDVTGLTVETEGARNAIGVLTVAIWVFAAVFALAGLVTIGIVVGRRVALGAGDQLTLRALGLTRSQRALAAALPSVPIALGGGVLAVLGAVALSSRFPFGLARRAEPDTGVRVDTAVLALGLVAVVAVVLAVAALAALRATRRAGGLESAARAPGASVSSRAAAAIGLSPVPATGLRMALEPGRGSTAVPVRSAIAGAAVAVVGILAVTTFGASLDHLVATPAAYGRAWDVEMSDVNLRTTPDGRDCGHVGTKLTKEEVLGSVAVVCSLSVQLANQPTVGFGFTQLKGHVAPLAVVAGRGPSARNEVALGRSTLDTLGKEIGDTVRARGPAHAVVYRIVGQVALPTLGDPQPLADGAAFTGSGIGRLEEPGGDTGGEEYLTGRFADGVDPVAATRHLNAVKGVDANRTRAVLPLEIERLGQIDDLPAILATFLALLAVVAIGHALVTAVRRRRRELAILKTLGFRQRQVRGTVAWQATTLSVAGLVVGIPLGVIVGRLVWGLVADDLGVAPDATVPVLALVLLVPFAILLANLLAALPARAAARTRPAVVLRSE